MAPKILLKTRNFFKFVDYKTTFKKEIIGGIVTGISMLYIFSVEPNMLHNAHSIDSNSPNMSFGGIFIATAITAFCGTLIMGFASNMPVATAPGMGLNAVFTFSVANTAIGYEGALIAVMFSSILFCIITISKIRNYLMQAVPISMRYIIGAAVGFFIAYIGLKNAAIVKVDPSGIPIAALSQLSANYPYILIAFFVFGLIVFFHVKKIPGGMLIAITIGLIISITIAETVSKGTLTGLNRWKGWNYGDLSGFKVNLNSLYHNFSNTKIWTSPVFYISIFIFLLVSFFDATGTLYSLSNQISLSDDEIKLKITHRALVADSFAGLMNGFIGISPSTTFTESAIGIGAGARSGFSSIITSLFFLFAIILYPLFILVSPCVSAGALLFVGCSMIKQLGFVDWKKLEYCFAGMFTIIVVLVTFTTTNGIAIGFIIYTLCLIFQKNEKK